MMAETVYEYRWVARFDNGEEWDSRVMESREAAESVASERQERENHYQAITSQEDGLTFSVERRVVVSPKPWEPINQDGA